MPFNFGQVILGVIENQDRLNENKRQFNEQLETNKSQFNASLAENQYQFKETRTDRNRMFDEEQGLREELGRGGLNVQKRYATVQEGYAKDAHAMNMIQRAAWRQPGVMISGQLQGKTAQQISNDYVQELRDTPEVSPWVAPMLQPLASMAELQGQRTSQKDPTYLMSTIIGDEYKTGWWGGAMNRLVNNFPGMSWFADSREVEPMEKMKPTFWDPSAAGTPEKDPAAIENFSFAKRLRTMNTDITQPWMGSGGRIMGEINAARQMFNSAEQFTNTGGR